MQTFHVSMQLLSLTDFWERKAQSPSVLRCTMRKVRQHVIAFMPSLELSGAYVAFYLFIKRVFHSIFPHKTNLLVLWFIIVSLPLCPVAQSGKPTLRLTCERDHGSL